MVSLSTKNTPKAHKLVVQTEYEGQRLDNFLFTYLKGVPKTRIYRIIRKGEVRVNQGRIKPDYRLVVGDLLRIPPVRQEKPKPLLELPWNDRTAHHLLDQILFEDDGLIILNKPAGIAVHGGSGVSFGVIEALRYLKKNAKTLELVHRLDRDTSGCLMIAKKRSILRAVHEQLQNGMVEKIYWTLVKGQWQGGAAVLAPLQKNHLQSGERMVRVSAEGQSALTEFKILGSTALATLMEAKPKTGRTHQIRVHAASVGHPIAGDPKYGEAEFNRVMKQNGLNRLFLHARQLILRLPGYQDPLSIKAPLEPELQACLARFNIGA